MSKRKGKVRVSVGEGPMLREAIGVDQSYCHPLPDVIPCSYYPGGLQGCTLCRLSEPLSFTIPIF